MSEVWLCYEDGVRLGLPGNCGVALGVVGHASVYAACGGGHVGVLGCAVVGIEQPVFHHHIIVHSSFSVPMA